MELRQLEAFVAVADELHFGRAAERLHVAAPTLSELIRRLEREVGTSLFTRTTRRVALTPAGSELLARAKVILDEVADAGAAVRRIAAGDAGAVRVGATPPAATVLAPHLVTLFADAAPQAEVELRRMWLPTLADALAAGEVDVAITCGTMPAHPGISSETFVAEELLVGLRDTHRFAAQQTVMLSQLCHDVLGVPPAALFPAWASSVHNALDEAGVAPPTRELPGTDLAGARWAEGEEIDWVLLISSVSPKDEAVVVLPVSPTQLVPFSLHWSPGLAHTTVVARFVRTALSSAPPSGWHTQAGHLLHEMARPTP
jgi:DNA-binding transcriptional LysR family regulator